MNYNAPSDIARNACATALTKANLSILQILALGVLAGGYIALGGFFMTVVTQDSAQYVGIGVTRLMAGAVFPVGLMMVVVGGGELFTGNCIMPIGYLAGCVPMEKILRNWFFVYVSNGIGAVIVALLVWKSGIASGACGVNALNIAVSKVNLTFPQMITRGILCNWLVAMGVWLSYGARDIVGKYFGCFFPTMAFVACGFEHSVANMYFVPLGMFLKGDAAIVQQAAVPAEKLARLDLNGLFTNLLPVTIGNILGAVIFIAGLYYIAYRPSLAEK